MSHIVVGCCRVCTLLIFNSKSFFPIRKLQKHHYGLKVLKKCSSEEDVPPAQGIWEGFGLTDFSVTGTLAQYACMIPSFSASPKTSILEGEDSVVSRSLFPKPGAQ